MYRLKTIKFESKFLIIKEIIEEQAEYFFLYYTISNITVYYFPYYLHRIGFLVEGI